jgi:hypothetical protein
MEVGSRDPPGSQLHPWLSPLLALLSANSPPVGNSAPVAARLVCAHLLTLVEFIRKRNARRRNEASLDFHPRHHRSKSTARNCHREVKVLFYTYMMFIYAHEERCGEQVKDHSVGHLRSQSAETLALLGKHLRLYQIHSATLESGVLADPEVSMV